MNPLRKVEVNQNSVFFFFENLEGRLQEEEEEEAEHLLGKSVGSVGSVCASAIAPTRLAIERKEEGRLPTAERGGIDDRHSLF